MLPAEIVVVVDHNPALQERLHQTFPLVHVMANAGRPGLSGARNTGVIYARGDVVAFLDDDAIAEPEWVAAQAAAYADPTVVGTAATIEPLWAAGRPTWFPPEFDWVVGCSYAGLPRTSARIRNPIGSTMSFRRAAILEAGGFHSAVGRVGTNPTGGEETELCIRIQRLHPDAEVVLVPSARVRHRVPAVRGTFSYFRSRCFQEGRSKARIAALEGTGPALASERTYATRTLPAAFLRGVGEALRGRPAGLARAAAVLAGLGLTTAGYVAERIFNGRPVSTADGVRRGEPG